MCTVDHSRKENCENIGIRVINTKNTLHEVLTDFGVQLLRCITQCVGTHSIKALCAAKALMASALAKGWCFSMYA